MKLNFLLLAVIICFSANAQKLEKNGIDEFQKVLVKETSQEQITGTSTNLNAILRAKQIDNEKVLVFKFISHGEAMAIAEKAPLMLKTKSDSVITIYSMKASISCIGCGSKGLLGSGNLGIEAWYSINDSQIDFLKNNPVVKIRFSEIDHYFEFDVKEKFQQVIINELKLLE